MSRRQPWMKWYPADWRAEPTLRMCRRPARSFWQDLLGLMHEAHRYGHLLINGVKPTNEQLARVTGDSEREVRTWLEELWQAGVYSKTEDGIIYSRRMVRDYLKAQTDAANGNRGGNPKLRANDNGGVNPQPNTPDKAQMLDARVQSPEEERPPIPSGSAPRKRGARRAPLPELVDLTPELRALAAEESRDPDREFAKCRDWCADNSERLTAPRFRNWLRNDIGKPKGSNNGRTRPRTPTEALRDDPEFVAAARRLGGLRGGAGPAGEEPPAEGPHAGDDRGSGEGRGQVPGRTLRIAAGSPGGDSASDHTRFGDVDRVSAAIGLGDAHRRMAGMASGETGPGRSASETSECGAPTPSHARILDAEDRGREGGRELASSGLDAGRVGPAEVVGSEADRPQTNRVATPRVIDGEQPQFMRRYAGGQP